MFVPEGLLAAVLIGLALVAGIGILAAGQAKTKADRTIVQTSDAYEAAKRFVLGRPGVKEPVVFAPLQDSVLESWGPHRWRVAGRAEAQDESDVTVQVLYTCVVEREGNRWMLEDISVQLLK